jgi:hypothetical protein
MDYDAILARAREGRQDDSDTRATRGAYRSINIPVQEEESFGSVSRDALGNIDETLRQLNRMTNHYLAIGDMQSAHIINEQAKRMAEAEVQYLNKLYNGAADDAAARRGVERRVGSHRLTNAEIADTNDVDLGALLEHTNAIRSEYTRASHQFRPREPVKYMQNRELGSK